MRISDWSSDVCSSDLEVPGDAVFAEDLVDAAIFTDALQKAALRDRKLLCHGRACWLLLTNNTLQFVSRRVQSFFRCRACRCSADRCGVHWNVLRSAARPAGQRTYSHASPG